MSRPVIDARVTIVDGPQTGLSTTTNDEGRFAFAPFKTPSDATGLRIERDGYMPATAHWRAPDEILVPLRSLTPLDIEGQYTITFAAAPECSQLPSAVRTRTYMAAVSPARPDRLNFTRDAFNWWLEDQPIIERFPSGAYVARMGTATTPVVSSTASITAAFDGFVSYCAVPREPDVTNYPPTCSAPVECKSDHHQLVLRRR